MTPALRWAAMRAILMFHNCEGQSHKTVSTDHNLWRERRAEADSNRGPSAYQPTALPLGQTGSVTHRSGAAGFVYMYHTFSAGLLMKESTHNTSTLWSESWPSLSVNDVHSWARSRCLRACVSVFSAGFHVFSMSKSVWNLNVRLYNNNNKGHLYGALSWLNLRHNAPYKKTEKKRKYVIQ